MARTLTTLVPDDYAPNQVELTITTPDGVYEIIRFPGGQIIGGEVFWWGVSRKDTRWTEVLTTSLEEAMGWLARRLLETCF